MSHSDRKMDNVRMNCSFVWIEEWIQNITLFVLCKRAAIEGV